MSGVLLFLSFPRFDLSVLAWIALVPLLFALDQKGLREAFLLSWATGIVFFTGSFYWIWSVKAYNLFDYLLLQVLYLPQYVSLFGLAFIWIRRRTGLSQVLIAPLLWVTLEYIRSHLSFLSLPWMLLGHSQYAQVSLIQMTAYTGVYGLSFLVVLTNAALAEALLAVRTSHTERLFARGPSRFALGLLPLTSLTVSAGLLLAALLYGHAVLNQASAGPTIKVGLVQGSALEDRRDLAFKREILDAYAGSTRRLAQQAPDLVVWPESSVPGDAEHDLDLQRILGRLAAETKVSLLVGSAEGAKFTDQKLFGKYYNNMVLFSPDGRLVNQYRKIRLLPFGEYDPLPDVVRWPKVVVAGLGNRLSGDRYTLLRVNDVAFGTVICWENIFPDLFREFVRQGARFMVNATNEVDARGTAASYQLLAMSTLRAAENRVAVARATNEGISALIDRYGRIVARLHPDDQREGLVGGALIGEVPLSSTRTFYTQHGDLFAYTMIVLCAVLLCASWIHFRFPLWARVRARSVEA